MPRITVTTNRCNVCKKTHRPNADDDDSDKLEAGTEDTDLPIFWTEATLRSKQPNPDFAKNERRVRKAIETQWPVAVQQVTQQNGGKPLTSEEVNELRDFLDQQARGDDDPPELVVVETEIILCDTCTPMLANLGLLLTELTANGTLPPAWAPAAAPTPVVSPPVAVAPVPASQPSAPPLSVVPAAAPAPTTPEPPSAA